MLALPGDYDGLPLNRALEKIFKINIDPKVDRERMAFIRLAELEAPQFPELKRQLERRGRDRSHEELSKWLADQNRRGLIAIDDADSAARILMDMVFGVFMFKGSGPFKRLGSKARKAHIRRCISIFLEGVLS